MPRLIRRDANPVLVLLSALALSIGCLAGCTSAGGPDDGLSDEPYVFPLSPETDPEEWARHDPDEAIEANMAPAVVLDGLSVTGLVETLLGHPSFGSCMFHDTVSIGVESLRDSTNVLDALLARDGGRERLAERLVELRQATGPGAEVEDSLRVACLEALVFQLDDPACAAKSNPGADYHDPQARAAIGCEP